MIRLTLSSCCVGHTLLTDRTAIAGRFGIGIRGGSLAARSQLGAGHKGCVDASGRGNANASMIKSLQQEGCLRGHNFHTASPSSAPSRSMLGIWKWWVIHWPLLAVAFEVGPHRIGWFLKLY